MEFTDPNITRRRELDRNFKIFSSEFPVLKVVASIDSSAKSAEAFSLFLSSFDNHGYEINVATTLQPHSNADTDGVEELRSRSVNLISKFLDKCSAMSVYCVGSVVERDGENSEDAIYNHAKKIKAHLVFDTAAESAKDSLVIKTVSDIPHGYQSNNNAFAYLASLVGRSFVRNASFE